jgi:hypothetical protein
MGTFNTSLLREKFVITDVMPGEISDKEPVIALSNRIVIPLIPPDKSSYEVFIIRSQNMHTCLRMAAKMAQDVSELGPIIGRKTKPVDWKAMYLSVCKGYEKKWNPDRWIAIYHKGRLVYEDGEGDRHPFLDIIEQCDARNKGDYEKSLVVAEDAFKHAGKMVTIDHDANVAAIFNYEPGNARCGVISRSPSHTTTLNFTAKDKAGRFVKISHCLSVAAAFLEGIQLAFLVGMTNIKVNYEIIASNSPEALQGRDASHKLGRLNGAITQFENLFDVSYRPERPNLGNMIDDAEDFAKKALLTDVEDMVE